MQAGISDSLTDSRVKAGSHCAGVCYSLASDPQVQHESRNEGKADGQQHQQQCHQHHARAKASEASRGPPGVGAGLHERSLLSHSTSASWWEGVHVGLGAAPTLLGQVNYRGILT
eukprot:1157444-Pelagomonas_calceolata.AAC.3